MDIDTRAFAERSAEALVSGERF